MTPRFRYPRFEENQVLSYQHLNQLTEFLEGEDRLSRRALIGAGAAYGLTLEHTSSQGLWLRRGAALTTDGSLGHLEADLLVVAARVYRDPVGYAPFHGGGGAESAQTELWELLEETPADTTSVSALTAAAGATFLADKAVLLYLEVTTADLDTCIDNHCINQGQERRGVWRVLLARRTDLTAIRQAALGSLTPWPAWALEELRPERLCLQSLDVLSHQALSTRGLDFVNQARTRLLPAIQESVGLYGALLEAPSQTTADALNALSTGFDAWLAAMVSGNRVGWQHGLDHVRHLYRAWAEFVEAAFGCLTEPAPLREPFPQHVLLGIVPTARYGEPDFLRHYFVPSPVLTLGGRDRELCRQRFLRLMALAATFAIPASRGARVTPGAALDHALDEQAVPFYYDPASVLGWWNAEATWRNRGRLLPCYHREALLNDPAVRDPLRFPADAWEFYRIEGHQGRGCREVEQTLDSLRRTYHLAFDVVTVTFGPDEPEATNCLCELEGLKVLYRVSAGEMRCHIARLLGFLGGLARPTTSGVAILDKFTLPDGAVDILFDLQKVEFLTLGTAAFRAPAKSAGATQPGAAGSPAATKATAAAGAAMAATATGASKSGVTAAAVAAVTAQTEDFRTVSVDNLRITYPIISVAVYPFLTPEALVNSLARELMGRLTEADGRLGVGVEEFNADQFSQTIQAARAKASDLTDALLGLSTDVEADVLKQRELLRQELLLFLANCVPTRVIQIATLFATALERLRATPTLAAFLRKHPGLEHLGGVPKGGTFVLVCGRPDASATNAGTVTASAAAAAPGSVASADRAVPSDLLAARQQAAFGQTQTGQSAVKTIPSTRSVSDSLLLKTYGLYQATPTTNTLVEHLATGTNLAAADKTLLTENYTPAATGPGAATIDLEAIYERLRGFFGIETGAQQDIVLADFCLPYLCCAECTCTTTVVLPPPPVTVSLPGTTFCANDETTYPVTAAPEGGTLLINGQEVTGLTFTPASVGQGGNVVIAYRLPDGRSASVTVTLVAAPVVAFEASEPDQVGGGWIVVFTNGTDVVTGDTYAWEFGDRETSDAAAPSHVYRETGTYTVRLTVTREPCAATAERDVAISPTPTVSLPATTFCANDDTSYPITVSPAGGILLVNGAAVANLTFIPTQFASSRTVSFEYRVGAQSASLTVVVQPAPVLTVSVNVGTPTADGAEVRLSVVADDPATTFTWRLPDGSTAAGATVTRRFAAPGSYAATLEAVRTPCTVTRVVSFDVPAPSPAPTIRLGETDNRSFCTTDSTDYSILVSPDGGQLLLNGVATTERIFNPAAIAREEMLEWTYRLSDGQSATLEVTLIAPATPAFSYEPMEVSPAGTVVRLFNTTEGEAEQFFWNFDDGQPEQTIADREFDRVFLERREYQVTLRAPRGPCTDAAITQSVDLREPGQPTLTFDPGNLDAVLADGLVREVVGGQSPDLLSNVTALNTRAADAASDPATRAALNTPTAEREIGAMALSVFEPLRSVLLERMAEFGDDSGKRLWEFGQIPIAATVYLSGLRTTDLTSSGEITRAFSVLKEILENLRGSAHGADLVFNTELTALLEATAADASKPVLQGLSNQTTTAFATRRGRGAPAKREPAPKPAKPSREPTARRTDAKRRRQP